MSTMIFGLGGCAEWFPNKYRFRMIVEVETSQGLKSGTGVFQVIARNMTRFTSEEHARDWEVHGQAVVVDLPDGPVFLLMKTGAPQGDLAGLSMAALDPKFDNDIVESAGRIAGSWSTLMGDVPRANYPLMVRFRNINDPKSVEAVAPDAIGVKRVWVETTRDPVTTGIEKRFPPWFDQLVQQKSSLSGRSMKPNGTRDLADLMGPGDFGTEIGK